MNNSQRGLALAGMLSLVALAAPALAEERRLDTFDTKSTRTGSATIDEKAGRIDLYDTKSNRIGSGTIDKNGRIDLFDNKGRRTGSGQITPGSPRSGGRR